MALSAKSAELVSVLFIAAGMSLLMSAAMLLLNVGMAQDFLSAWMKSWAVSTAVAYPAALMIVPLGRKLTVWLTSSDSSADQK